MVKKQCSDRKVTEQKRTKYKLHEAVTFVCLFVLIIFIYLVFICVNLGLNNVTDIDGLTLTDSLAHSLAQSVRQCQ